MAIATICFLVYNFFSVVVNAAESILRLEDVLVHLQNNHGERSKFTLEIPTHTSTIEIEVINASPAILPGTIFSVFDRPTREVGDLGHYSLVSASDNTFVSLSVNSNNGLVRGVIKRYREGWIRVGFDTDEMHSTDRRVIENTHVIQTNSAFEKEALQPTETEQHSLSNTNRDLLAFHSNYLYTLDIHVDIDYSLVSKNGGTLRSAFSFIDSLFTAANVILEREILTHLNVKSIRQVDIYHKTKNTHDALDVLRDYSERHGRGFDLHYALLGEELSGACNGVSGVAFMQDSSCDSLRGVGLVSNLLRPSDNMGERFGSDFKRLLYALAHSIGSVSMSGMISHDIGTDSLLYTFGGKWDGLGMINDVNFWIDSPYQNTIAEPRQISYHLFMSVKEHLDYCLDGHGSSEFDDGVIIIGNVETEMPHLKNNLASSTTNVRGNKRFRASDSTKAKTTKKNDAGDQPKNKEDESKAGKEDKNKKPKADKKSKTDKSEKAESSDNPTNAPTTLGTPNPITQTPTPAPTTTSPTQTPTPAPTLALLADESICLTNPEDIYRTCFQRAKDPNNNLTEDTVQRTKYNIGAALYQRGENITASSDFYIAPYTEPYITSGEGLTNGTVYLSIVRNNNTNLTCNDKIELEETALEWLYDNIGGPETFTPICAFNDGYALHSEVATSDDGSQTTIRTAAFKMNFIFVTNTSWFNETSGSPNVQRRLAKCSQQGQQECCCADAFNGLKKIEKKTKKKYCKQIGCKKCPIKKKKRSKRDSYDGIAGIRITQHLRSLKHTTAQRTLIEEDLNGIEFQQALAQYTRLEPNETGAVLNATNLEDLATCRANNFNAVVDDNPTLECEEYANRTCDVNDFITVDSNETETAYIVVDSSSSEAFCLPDDYSCIDEDYCTVDTWDEMEEICKNTPVSCPINQSCDPTNGQCKSDEMLVPCISIIDESDDYNSSAADWDAFRAAYPDRPFCLLVPSSNRTVDIPPKALEDPNFQVYDVIKDEGTAAPDDWFQLCGLDEFGSANVPYVGMFVDRSGSMAKWEVKNSYNNFLADAQSANLTVCEVFGEDENWISPFLINLTPNVGECLEPVPHPAANSPLTCAAASKVKIQLDTDKDIALFEVQVLSGGYNIASDASVYQSSTLQNNNVLFGANNAVDEDNATYSQTYVDAEGSPVWWEIDFGSNYDIDSVSINNTGCDNQGNPAECFCNMTDAQIFLINASGTVVASRHSFGDTCDTPYMMFDFKCHSLIEIGNDKRPDYVFPLQKCQGDCDSDSDCADGLFCFARDVDNVPGCHGFAYYESDYCVERPANYLWWTWDDYNATLDLLGKCEGDCDDDIECEPGLVCMQRNEWESVPGCDGIGEYGYDYCYDPTE